MSRRRNQSGLAALELVLILVIVALIGFIGYKVYNANHAVDTTQANAEKSSTVTTTDTVPAINSADDLTTAQKTLDATNPDDNNTDSAQLDTDLASF